ncbi:hypothetical protein [Polymorphospora rubra]|uniref:Uncharacterized protein n=1 Tax=Polymorphospora rubra TaxID=338584 RepID=A0A810MWT4_9ACTN|nr:hypothetical protein [Polymorphospora rubra]BCJ65020.1 hypothetical protein Prubr_20410 [Polymorphospora rubra]
MSVDGEPARRTEPGYAAADDPAPVSRGTVVAYGCAAALLFGWFLFGWLVQQQGFVDSVGEALGTASVLLLLVSIVGMARRDRH